MLSVFLIADYAELAFFDGMINVLVVWMLFEPEFIVTRCMSDIC